MKNILVIERDDDSLALLKEILEDKGYNVLGTTSIENGLDILKRGIPLQLIMLSTFVENKESFSIIERIKQDSGVSSIPLIAITSSTRTNEGARALKEGCAAYVSKPIDEEAVLSNIEHILEGKDVTNYGKDISS